MLHTRPAFAAAAAVGDRLTDALASNDGAQRTRALVRLRKLLVASVRQRPAAASAAAAAATSESASAAPAATLPLALVQRVCDEYEHLDDAHARAATLRSLAAELSADVPAAVPLAAKFATVADADSVAALRAADALRIVLTPPYTHLFHLVANHHAHGVAFLLRLRRDMLVALDTYTASKKGGVAVSEPWSPVDVVRIRAMSDHLRDALATWFCVSMLRLERITWVDSAPALLRRIAEAEAVHVIASDADLQRRAARFGRRLFAFTHHALPADEPAAFVNIALTARVPARIDDVLGDTSIDDEASARVAERVATCAIFYSITSAQPGLSGVELGNHLIKSAVRRLRAELPALRTFCTLSPVPGFRRWLVAQLQTNQRLLLPSERLVVQRVAATMPIVNLTAAAATAVTAATAATAPVSASASTLKPESDEAALLRLVHPPPTTPAALAAFDGVRSVLARVCAHYLLHAKQRSPSTVPPSSSSSLPAVGASVSVPGALDPVANFHLRNGALVWRVCAHGCSGAASARGREHSVGMMVNYMYDDGGVEGGAGSSSGGHVANSGSGGSGGIEARARAYAERGALVATDAVRHLASGVQQPTAAL